jgi:cystathionine beta-lyase
MAELCLARNVLIGSDEIHSDLSYKNLREGTQPPGGSPRHIPIASLDPEIAQHTLTFFAPSKTFNLPGLQASVLIIQNAELRQRYQTARQMMLPWVNVMGLTALQAAYREGQSGRSPADDLGRNRDFVYDCGPNCPASAWRNRKVPPADRLYAARTWRILTVLPRQLWPSQMVDHARRAGFCA